MNEEQELLAVFTAEVSEQLEQVEGIVDQEPASWDVELLFRLVHNVKGAARMVNAASIKLVAHLLEEVLSVVRSRSLSPEEAADAVREGARLLRNAFVAFSLGETMDESDAATFLEGYDQVVESLLGDLPEARALVPPAVGPGAAVVERAEAEREQVVDTPERAGSASSDTLRISVDKLDNLMGLASEFALTVYEREEILREANQLRETLQLLVREVSGLAGETRFQHARRAVQNLAALVARDEHRGRQLSSQLQESIRALRMVRVDSLKTFFTRVVREACEISGKQAELRFEGGDTELDRAVLDGLRDPIVHLLRNSIAHGIEAGPERLAAGKPEKGTLTLRARSAGPWVEIHVLDDGGGVNVGAVRARAMATGLLADTDAEADEQTVLDCLFQAGFSTAKSVTELAGRGVGLDVVRSNVAAMGGQIQVRNHPGVGAEFHLQVPLTRLTTRGILVRLADQYLAFPVMNVERTMRVEADDIAFVENNEVIRVGGQPIMITRLEDALRLGSESGELQTRPGVVLTEGHRRRVYLVDEVLGEAEFTIQALSWNLKGLAVLSGSTVLEGGRVVLVLNPAALLALEARRGSGERTQVTQRSRRRILVADDSVTSRTLERNILQAAGYEVTLAVDGEDAWSKLMEDEFDLLISDVEMPRLMGTELVKRVRGHQRTERLPAILVTSLGNEEHKRAGAQAGANAYIVKGAFDQDDLLRAVSRLL